MKQYFEKGDKVFVINLGAFKDLEDRMQLTIKERGWSNDEYLYSFEESDTKLSSRYITDQLPENTEEE